MSIFIFQAVTIAGISFESFNGYSSRPIVLVRSFPPPGEGEHYMVTFRRSAIRQNPALLLPLKRQRAFEL
jgi:hypothetical protein